MGRPTEIVADPHRALARARELAGPGGRGDRHRFIYLIADLLAPGAARPTLTRRAAFQIT